MAVIEFIDREGEIRRARPCDEDTVINNISQDNAMYHKVHSKTGYERVQKNHHLIDLMKELKQKQSGLAAVPHQLHALQERWGLKNAK